MEQILLKHIGVYTFPFGTEPIILSYRIEHLYKEGENITFDGKAENGDLMYGRFSALNEEQQKIIFDRFNELN